jgi:hypothetical protein
MVPLFSRPARVNRNSVCFIFLSAVGHQVFWELTGEQQISPVRRSRLREMALVEMTRCGSSLACGMASVEMTRLGSRLREMASVEMAVTISTARV